jgi:hypothetical protein
MGYFDVPLRLLTSSCASERWGELAAPGHHQVVFSSAADCIVVRRFFAHGLCPAAPLPFMSDCVVFEMKSAAHLHGYRGVSVHPSTGAAVHPILRPQRC